MGGFVFGHHISAKKLPHLNGHFVEPHVSGKPEAQTSTQEVSLLCFPGPKKMTLRWAEWCPAVLAAEPSRSLDAPKISAACKRKEGGGGKQELCSPQPDIVLRQRGGPLKCHFERHPHPLPGGKDAIAICWPVTVRRTRAAGHETGTRRCRWLVKTGWPCPTRTGGDLTKP